MPLYAVDWSAYDYTRSQRLDKARAAWREIKRERAEPGFAWLDVPCDILVMAEETTDCVWSPDHKGDWLPWGAAELPVPARLAARFLLWAHCYEDHEDAWFEHTHVKGAAAPPFSHFAAIDRRGFRLACALKRALPDCKIEFFDEHRKLPWRSYRPDEQGQEVPRIFEITPEVLRHETTTRA